MKANEVPEKIYVSNYSSGLTYNWHNERLAVNDIEYVRKDAFVEKACEFIRKGGNRGDAYIVTEFGEEVFDFVQLAEDFKNYMKGE